MRTRLGREPQVPDQLQCARVRLRCMVAQRLQHIAVQVCTYTPAPLIPALTSMCAQRAMDKTLNSQEFYESSRKSFA